MDTLVVRPAEISDTPGIHALIASVYAEYDCVLDVERDERHLLEPGPYFRSTGGQFWVIESLNAIVGTGAVMLFASHAELKTVYIHPDFRRRGWAKHLIELAVNHALESGRTHMSLWSDTRFLNAHTLYESLGFRRTDYRKLMDLNHSKEYGYELDLVRSGRALSSFSSFSGKLMECASTEHTRRSKEEPPESRMVCEACRAEIPLEHQKPKPYCRRCGWVLS